MQTAMFMLPNNAQNWIREQPFAVVRIIHSDTKCEITHIYGDIETEGRTERERGCVCKTSKKYKVGKEFNKQWKFLNDGRYLVEAK